ncbi:hypothetical protein [Streptomyces ipomoeae]|uniref:hypothetical protein n=1 Tax=Streptomyces ipomoeae TaxID=103232 RepID=UPI001147483A|nr:hypothetical protein [Streptomyces ipomoeae]TQE39105.1 hypothetical protein Sipo7851_05120 [Streptomyces ipomoeae]
MSRGGPYLFPLEKQIGFLGAGERFASGPGAAREGRSPRGTLDALGSVPLSLSLPLSLKAIAMKSWRPGRSPSAAWS